MSRFLVDAQQALGFLVSQTSFIESTVYETQYPGIQYQDLIPIDTSAYEWAKSITFYSSDRTGKAEFFHHYGQDLAIADVERTQHEVAIHMANIGYRYTLEELGVAMQLGIPLTAERAAAAVRAYEEKVDEVALRGEPTKGLDGLINYPGVTAIDAAEVSAEGGGVTTDWNEKTADQILADINSAIVGVHVDSLTVETADTILLPVALASMLATRRLGDTTMTLLQFLRDNNSYTFQTGQPLTIRAVRGLETAGEGGTGRMVVYRRDPSVLKMHIPMPHRFLPVWQTGALVFDVPGIFRLAGLEIRRPGAVRYVDGLTGDLPS